MSWVRLSEFWLKNVKSVTKCTFRKVVTHLYVRVHMIPQWPAGASIKRAKLCESERKYRQSFANYFLLAHQGDILAQYEVAVAYRLGKGIGEDWKNATFWMERSANQNFPPAQFWLGSNEIEYCYRDDEKVQYETCLKLIHKSAEAGYFPAQNYLGWVYEQGRWAIEIDSDLALKWYTRAADCGSSEAQFRLFEHYSMRSPIEYVPIEERQKFSDKKCADEWLIRAVVAGHPEAQYALACELFYVEDTVGASLELMYAAALNGSASAHHTLASLFKEGSKKVPLDPIKALVWGKIAEKSTTNFSGANDFQEFNLTDSSLSPEEKWRAEMMYSIITSKIENKRLQRPSEAYFVKAFD